MSSRGWRAGSDVSPGCAASSNGACASWPTRITTRPACARSNATASSSGTSSRSRCPSSRRSTTGAPRAPGPSGCARSRSCCRACCGSRPAWPASWPRWRRSARSAPCASARCARCWPRACSRSRTSRPGAGTGACSSARPQAARGRQFRVVFVPGLAERIFPQRLREDALLVDARRAALEAGLPMADTRADDERLQLRLAVGAAAARVYLSYPRLELAESRPRVPSFYVLDVMRATTGVIPRYDALADDAFGARQRLARLARAGRSGRGHRRSGARPGGAEAAAARAALAAGTSTRAGPATCSNSIPRCAVRSSNAGRAGSRSGRRPTASSACSR